MSQEFGFEPQDTFLGTHRWDVYPTPTSKETRGTSSKIGECWVTESNDAISPEDCYRAELHEYPGIGGIGNTKQTAVENVAQVAAAKERLTQGINERLFPNLRGRKRLMTDLLTGRWLEEAPVVWSTIAEHVYEWSQQAARVLWFPAEGREWEDGEARVFCVQDVYRWDGYQREADKVESVCLTRAEAERLRDFISEQLERTKP